MDHNMKISATILNYDPVAFLSNKEEILYAQTSGNP
jgi:hypothetical protein